MPFYGTLLVLVVSYLGVYPLFFKISILLAVLFLTCLLPALLIYLLHQQKIIASVSLNDRRERLLPYLFTLLCYGACTLLLYKLKLPLWFLSYFVGGSLAILVAILVNLKWKISAHMTGAGGLLALSFALFEALLYYPLALLLLAILLTGMLGSARIYLRRHTLGEVAAGTINGFLCVYLPLWYTLLFS